MKPIIGYIPAGGRGMRMKPFKLIKELLPVVVKEEDKSKVILLIENAVEVLAKGGVQDIICTVNKDKEVLMHTVSEYMSEDKQVNFAFVFQNNLLKEYGMPFAIAGAAPFLRGHTVFMKFPDTILYPMNCFETLYEFHKEKKADLTLGVFPTHKPQSLGPVLVDEDGKVILIEDKPEKPCANNTWNILIWEDSFLDLLVNEVECYRTLQENRKELLIFDVFKKALEDNYRVYAHVFEEGECIDISCIHDATQLWAKVN